MYIHSYYNHSRICWSESKNLELIRGRDASFAELLQAQVLEIRENPVRSGQKIALIEFRDYIWVLPFVSAGDQVFLKTAYPSRVYTREWRSRRAS